MNAAERAAVAASAFARAATVMGVDVLAGRLHAYAGDLHRALTGHERVAFIHDALARFHGASAQAIAAEPAPDPLAVALESFDAAVSDHDALYERDPDGGPPDEGDDSEDAELAAQLGALTMRIQRAYLAGDVQLARRLEQDRDEKGRFAATGRSKAAGEARKKTREARGASDKAKTTDEHAEAARQHREAAEHHERAAKASRKAEHRASHERVAAEHRKVAEEHDKLADPHAAFAKGLEGKKLEGVKAFGGKKGEVRGVNEIQTAKVGGHDVFVKPGGKMFDAKRAVDDHGAVVTAAKDMGVGHMVMPATLHKDNRKRDAFVTKSAGDGFGSARSNPEACAKVSEHDKLAGALIDHLHSNSDRHGNNVLVHADGRMVLIDHDYCHQGNAMRSVFTTKGTGMIKGDPLKYASEQKSIHNLPPKMQEHVRALVASTDADIAKKYGVSEQSARAMRRRAGYVAEHGLDKSIANFD